jgi:hypothetical protein
MICSSENRFPFMSSPFVSLWRTHTPRGPVFRGKVDRSLGAPQPGPAHHLRVIDESGEDYVYPEALFRAIELPVPIQRALALAMSAA